MTTRHYYVLITGLMSSGKSTLISEYIHNFGYDEFYADNAPKVQYQGLDFEFLDAVFAIKRENTQYNFYELDAPTIQKWWQFVKAADGIITVYNHSPGKIYGTHDNLKNAIYTQVRKNIPIIFVANNYSSKDKAKSDLIRNYDIDSISNNPISIKYISSGERYFDEEYGYRVKINPDNIKNIFDKMIMMINNV